MKKTLLTIAIVLGMTLGAVAQKQGGGLFGMGDQRGYMTEQEDSYRTGAGLLSLPGNHGEETDQPTPLGTGALLLIGFGAAYTLKKRKK